MSNTTASTTAAPTSTTAMIASGPSTEQVMAAWSAMHNGMAIGTRRPTAYPEWVTLEVAEGGFATGRALALIADGDVSSADFMASGGLATLEDMLATGRYRIDQPENAALLVVVWLLQKGRGDEAHALFAEIAPYMDELRFYPRATAEPCGASSTVAAVTNVGVMRTALETLKRRNDAFEASPVSHRHNQQRRQRAVAEGYAELQGDAIALLLGTVPSRETFLGLDPASPADVETAAGQLFAVLAQGDDERDRAFADGVAEIEARAADLAQRFGSVPSHQRATSTTALVLSALRSGVTTATADRLAVARRVLEVAKARGVKGSDAFAKYLARTAVSAIPDQRISAKADAVLARVEPLPAEATIAKAEADVVLRPVAPAEIASSTSAPSPLPPAIVRIVRRATADTLEELIKGGVVVSAEMIAAVLPGMLSAAAGACIEDEAARTLYAQLSVSFAKRRSLLLVNLEKQVRLEELPWARPILGLMQVDEQKQCDVVVREAVRCYFTYFPATVTPNKVVSALKDVMRKGVSTKANLMEELAADIFQNAFSPNFDAAAVVAARMMKDTVYSRYYDLGAVYNRVGEEYPKIQEEIRVLREAKAAHIAEREATTGCKRVDYRQKGREEVQKIFDAYTAETGKIVYSRRHLAPLSPRGEKAKTDVYNCWGDVYKEIASTSDPNEYSRVSLEVQRRQKEICMRYYEETGKGVLHYEYMVPQLVASRPPTTPREEAAEKAMQAIEEEYNELQIESYNPGYKIQKEIDSKGMLIGLAKQKMSDWQMPHDGSRYNSVQGGRTIEAAMVITTHNLAQLVDMCGGDLRGVVDFGAAAVKAWASIVSTFVSPPRERRAVLHARRDVAYAWRQILFFISCVEGGADAQREVLARMQAVVEARARKVRPGAAEVLTAHFLSPLEAVIGGAVHTIAEGAKVTDGAIVLGYYGWRSFGGCAKEDEKGDSDNSDAIEDEDEEGEDGGIEDKDRVEEGDDKDDPKA